MQEIWKIIGNGYERYEVSSYGRIRSFAQDSVNGKIKEGYPDHKGYMKIRLYNRNGESKFFPIHRLVAEAFIENPHNFPFINHKDEDKSNNHVENLEWCTNEYNINYGTRNERAAKANRCCRTTSTRVYSVDENGQVEYFDSIGEAERQTGNSHCNIVRALKGRRSRCGGRQWFYC